jgi:hypothetical protein
MSDRREDDPMLHDALVRARTGGAGNPLAGPRGDAGAGDRGTAGMGGPRDDETVFASELVPDDERPVGHEVRDPFTGVVRGDAVPEAADADLIEQALPVDLDDEAQSVPADPADEQGEDRH